MKCFKVLGLVAVVLAVSAGIASASTVTSPAGTAYTGPLKLTSEGFITLDNEIGQWVCNWSVEGKVEAHGSAVTAGGKNRGVNILPCNAGSSAVLNPGSLEFHTDTESIDGNGRVTLSGFELEVFIFGLSCKYAAGAGIDFGTLTGSKTTASNATLALDSAKLPRTGGSIFCGASGTLTGSFKVTTPTYLDID